MAFGAQDEGKTSLGSLRETMLEVNADGHPRLHHTQPIDCTSWIGWFFSLRIQRPFVPASTQRKVIVAFEENLIIIFLISTRPFALAAEHIPRTQGHTCVIAFKRSALSQNATTKDSL